MMIDCNSGTYLRAFKGFTWAIGTIYHNAPSLLPPLETFHPSFS